MPLPFVVAGAVALGATVATGVATGAAAGAAGAAATWHHRRWLAYHRRKGVEPPAGAYRLAQVESRDGAALLWWSLRAAWRDGWMRPHDVSGPPVVCVHGYTQNGTNFWGIRRALAGCGHPTAAVSLHHRLAPMSWYARRLRRSRQQQPAAASGSYSFGACSLDRAKRVLSKAGAEVRLSAMELKVLEYLIEHEGAVVLSGPAGTVRVDGFERILADLHGSNT